MLDFARIKPPARVVLLVAIGFGMARYDGGFTLALLFVAGVAITMARRIKQDEEVDASQPTGPVPAPRTRAVNSHATVDQSSFALHSSSRPSRPAATNASEALFTGAAVETAGSVTGQAPRGSIIQSRVVQAAPSRAPAAADRQKPSARGWLLAPIKAALGKLHPKAYAYFRGVLGFIIALATVTALKQGVQLDHRPFATLNLLFPTLVLSIMIAPVLVVALRKVATAVMSFGIRRGFADMLVGMIMTSIYWLPLLFTSTSGASRSLFDIIGFAFCGAMAGFEFWRADGYPGLPRPFGQWLGSFKDGFLKGLSR